jgi:hypothetical protein
MALLDNLFMAQTPDYLTSLLGDSGVQDLQKKALTSGLVNTAIGYLAAPKNQRLGLGRILAGAYQQGMTGAQGTVDKATQDYINAQKIGELKQKAEADKAWADIQDKIYTKTPDVTKQVTTAGGYAPSADQVAPEQATPISSLLTSVPTQPVPTEQSNLLSAQPTDVNAPTVSTAPNFNMVQQPDVTATQTIAGKPSLNSDLIQQFVTKYPSDDRAQKLLANMEMIKKLGTAEKGSHVLSNEEKQLNKLTVDGTTTGEPLKGTWQIDSTGKLDQVSGTEQKIPDIVSLQNERDKLVTQNINGKNSQRIKEIQGEIDKKTGVDQDPPIRLTEQAKEMNARLFLTTGTMPVFGMGKNASNARDEIYNKATQIGLSMGMTPAQIAQQIADSKQDYSTASKGLKDFSSGANGNVVRSLNVVVSHLDVLNELSAALDSNDVRLINKVRNAWRTETGSDAPTSFNAAKIIVGDELIKAIVARGGTEDDRREMKKTLDAASSPKQLQGVIKSYQSLLGGQLAGLEKQYEASTKRADFRDRFLHPRTIQTLPMPNTGENKVVPSSDVQKKADAIIGL